ncbi:MAG: protein adenylyltransferase SelO family protein, partial [Methylotenera sp.]
MNSALSELTENFGFNFDNSYTQLPDSLFQKILPTPVKQPALAIFNSALAETLGLNSDALIQTGADYLAGNKIFTHALPIAQAYAGHQFGGFNVLGDGRAILLGEHISPHQKRVDVQLKGAGRTAYSRSGDGRAALGPMLREYIISEAMHALGVSTTRSLAVVYTGETVFRDDAYPGAVLTRIASSHIRVGTFQYAAAINDISALKALADYTI